MVSESCMLCKNVREKICEMFACEISTKISIKKFSENVNLYKKKMRKKGSK